MAPPPGRGLARSARSGLLVLPALVLLAVGSIEAALAWFLACRGAYVLFIGFSLRAQAASGWWTRRYGVERGFERFRSAAALLMTGDAASIVLVCWLGRNTLTLGPSLPVRWFLGCVLVAVGILSKAWAVRTLGEGSFWWKGSFVPGEGDRFVTTGPYRWFRNPMYTLGYLHAYGLALVLGSLPGLFAAAVAQGLMLAMNHWAERPRTEALRTAAHG